MTTQRSAINKPMVPIDTAEELHEVMRFEEESWRRSLGRAMKSERMRVRGVRSRR
jgi:hypothetical protein